MLIIFAAILSATSLTSAESPTLGSTRDLTLQEFRHLVLERNESLQIRVLELKIAGKRLKGERGIFEPELLLGYDRVENQRENTAEQRRSNGALEFDEKNNIYTTGIEGLVPSGAKIRLGYTLRDLRNNLQDPLLGTISTNKPGAEFQTFAGISLTQPLLKNAWFPSTMASIRLAALAGDVAFQEYRRQMMLVITTAEAAYWNLYLAQEQVRFFRDSVLLAEGLVRDNETRFAGGRGSELEVLEAKSGLALRRSKLAEAEQKYFETVAQMSTLISESANDSKPLLHATGAPGELGPVPEFSESGQAAFGLNPDYLSQVKKLKQENIRVAYAKNQRLPQLDLKASFGLNGLGSDPQSSWDDIQQGGFPSFSAGVELHIPLGGGIRVKNELEAARLRKQQALISLQEIENQVLSAITTSLWKLRSARDSIGNYEQIVAFTQNLLETELKRLEVGKVDSRRVLDVEAAVFDAKNSVVEAKVRTERARLELELVQGTVLRSRNLEVPLSDVENRTIRLLRDAGIPSQEYRDLLKSPPPDQRATLKPKPFPAVSAGAESVTRESAGAFPPIENQNESR